MFGRKQRLEQPGGLSCPVCGDREVRLGHVDRVRAVAVHTCVACRYRWTDRLIDLTAEPATIVSRHH